MKILDKRGSKDYYDYLTGVYGIDDKLVLDRRKKTFFGIIPTKISLYIAGFVVEGLYIKGKFYYGEDLRQFSKKKQYRWLSKHYKRDYTKSITVSHADLVTDEWVYTEPVKDLLYINEKENCPIVMSRYDNTYYNYPTLKDFKLGSFIEPEVIYKWISTWLSMQLTKKESDTVVRTDVEKLLSKGFDKIASFRPKIKK